MFIPVLRGILFYLCLKLLETNIAVARKPSPKKKSCELFVLGRIQGVDF